MNNRTSGPGPANLSVPGSKPMGNMPPWLQKGKGKSAGKAAAAGRKMSKLKPGNKAEDAKDKGKDDANETTY